MTAQGAAARRAGPPPPPTPPAAALTRGARGGGGRARRGFAGRPEREAACDAPRAPPRPARSSTATRAEPQPGDLIQISRPLFEHWALSVGDGYVVHVAPLDGSGGASPAWLSSSSIGWAMVKKERLQDILRGDTYCVNNKYDKTRTLRPVEEILAKANGKVGKKMFYNVFLQNCEHFVTELRYGRSISHQVQDVVTAVAVGSLVCISPWLCALAVAVTGGYVFLREFQ